MRVTEDIVKSPKVIDSLAGRRSEYDGAFLIVAPMPSPLHEFASQWFWRTCTYNICSLLNEKEEDWIESGMMYRILPGQCDEEDSFWEEICEPTMILTQIAHRASTMSIKKINDLDRFQSNKLYSVVIQYVYVPRVR